MASGSINIPLTETTPAEGEVMDRILDQIRAWKDPAYRATLPEPKCADLDSPIPSVDLMDPSLGRINGGRRDTPISWCLPWRC